MRCTGLRHFLAALVLLATPGLAATDDVHVMISAGFFHAYSELGPKFEKQTGHRLITVRGPSMGDSPESIPTRLTRGEPAVVARGESEIGFQQVSEVINVPGTTYVGPIPAELQPGFTFAGALTTKARSPKAGEQLINFLVSPEAARVIEKAGLAAPK